MGISNYFFFPESLKQLLLMIYLITFPIFKDIRVYLSAAYEQVIYFFVFPYDKDFLHDR